MTAPYFEQGPITVYHGDCRDILPEVEADTVVTDPVWPDADVDLVGRGAEGLLLRQALEECTGASRVAIQVGCDTDPRFQAAVPGEWGCFRTAWLELPKKGCRGRLLHTGDVAYLYGEPPPSREGHHVIPGRYIDADPSGQQRDHPTPRRQGHVEWIVKWWSAPSDVIVDPFAGSGTTGLAALEWGRDCVLVEVEEEHCETIVDEIERLLSTPRLPLGNR